ASATSAPTARRWSPSQRDDQVADLGGLGEEWVVAGVEFHDAGCSTGELALPVGRGAPVFRADEVRRGHLLPGRKLHRLLEHRQALPGRLVHGLSLDLRI